MPSYDTPVRPIRDKVLIKLEPKPESFNGIIYLPVETYQDKAVTYGTVISAGPGFENPKTGNITPLDKRIVPGARVVYHKLAGTEIKIKDEEHRLVPSKDIMGFLVEPEESEDEVEEISY